ncbi:MAG TPA: hypothetical protein VK571_05625 [Gemmatimonadaceae bacterium]|jgi:hypothetical protein|nr:hypothetical protein [Gemmatimonadaceae bacterium]
MSRLTFTASLLLAVSSSSHAQQAVFAANDTGPASDAIFETKDAAVASAGMIPLSKTLLPKGQREVRIWYSTFGNPQYLVIIRQNGTNVTGRLMLWWDQYYESTPSSADIRVDNFVRRGYDCGPISKRDSHFGEDRWISSICEAKLKGTPDWKAFLSEVEAHALSQSGDVAPAEDQSDDENWGITVERRSGTIYGVSHYHTALTLAAPEPGRGPKLQDMVGDLAAAAKREPVVAQQNR